MNTLCLDSLALTSSQGRLGTLTLLGCLSLLVACGPDGQAVDASSGDAATRDAATRDAATRDAATRDAATRDAATGDAGSLPPADVVPTGLHEIHVATDGDDGAACSADAPCLTFARAAEVMVSGDELVVHPGRYPLAVHGSLRLFTSGGSPVPLSGAVPSGIDADQPTVIRALTPGSVDIEGGLTLGTRSAKVRYAFIYGLTFHGGGQIYNGDYNVVKACGFEGGFAIGTIDHAQGNTFNLLEDVWLWGKNVRVLGINYRAHHNTWRRVLLRTDGCDEDYCGERAGNYAVALSAYNSHDTTFENVLVLDRVLGANPYGYADFATAQHDSSQPEQPEGERLGRNRWLGCMSIHSEDAALVFEADAVETGTTGTLIDFVALDTAAGVSIDPAHRPYTGNSVFRVERLWSYPRGDGSNAFHIGCDVVQAGDPGCAHDVTGVESGAYAGGLAATTLPETRYGAAESLWPWPHEERIKAELCATETRGLCGSTDSLSAYVHSF
ncbi:MAG: hypothetical protein GXP55_00025 [Deltaproteobacteria bacterium]|nr:hypothetical protein [Deltaproteobacteria bacterium]